MEKSISRTIAEFAVNLTRAFGWGARSVGDPAELPEALAECLTYDGPCVLDVRVSAQENCFPMIANGRGHQHMLLADGNLYEEASESRD